MAEQPFEQQLKATSTWRGRIRVDGISLDTWAVIAASLFIILIVAGVLPRVPW